jgi:hypothetical protein
MVKTWHSGPSGTFNCQYCGALYEVTITRFPTRDKDDAICQCCHEVMAEWDDAAVPSFKLIEAPKKQAE